jgi:hypothetical protein
MGQLFLQSFWLRACFSWRRIRRSGWPAGLNPLVLLVRGERSAAVPLRRGIEGVV